MEEPPEASEASDMGKCELTQAFLSTVLDGLEDHWDVPSAKKKKSGKLSKNSEHQLMQMQHEEITTVLENGTQVTKGKGKITFEQKRDGRRTGK